MGQLHVRQLGDLVPNDPLGNAWERLVLAQPAGGIMQSLHWAAVKRRQGLATFHMGLFDGDDLVGGALCYAPSRARGAGILMVPEGPILPWDEPDRARPALRALVGEAEREAARRGVLALRIEPRLEAIYPPMLRSFGRAPVDVVPTETLYLDLHQDQDAILRSMRPKARYNIGLAARRGVGVREERTPHAVERFYGVLDEAARRDGFFLEPFSFFAALAETLCPAGLGRFLFAEHEGDTLAVMLLVTYGRRATYLYGGTTAVKRNLMAGYALQWAAIGAARGAGCEVYDLYGYEPHGLPSHVYAGFSRFKRQFGGRLVRFCGAHDYFFLDSLADVVVRVAQESGSAR